MKPTATFTTRARSDRGRGKPDNSPAGRLDRARRARRAGRKSRRRITLRCWAWRTSRDGAISFGARRASRARNGRSATSLSRWCCPGCGRWSCVQPSVAGRIPHCPLAIPVYMDRGSETSNPFIGGSCQKEYTLGMNPGRHHPPRPRSRSGFRAAALAADGASGADRLVHQGCRVPAPTSSSKKAPA